MAINATLRSTSVYTVVASKIDGRITTTTPINLRNMGVVDLLVVDGGTGRDTFITNGIVYGNGTAPLQVTAAGTEGKVLQAGVNGTPVFDDIDAGTF
jgi:hypothetical protein